tara:strand:+ start:407 stop:805 length:399 start_codon:yes stop_codon:yes gene_type:complete
MKTVMCAGTFDILHKGHLFYLKESKKQGDNLVVIIARDLNVEKIKDKKPINNEQDRLETIKALEFIDKAILGNKGNIFNIIEEIKPDIICLGYDQKIDEKDLKEELKNRKLNTKIIRIKSFKPEIYKSSKMK